jgi:hypothetical protein
LLTPSFQIDARDVVAALAEELAPRLAAELAGQVPSEPTAEPWHLLDVEEAAARLGRSTRWIRDRAKVGDLPHIRLDGGALAFELDDLRSFTRERRIPLAACLQVNGDAASHAGSRAPHLPRIQKVDAA